MLGSWNSIQARIDPDNNVVQGNVDNCMKRKEVWIVAHNRLVGVVGIDDTVVVETKDAVLVILLQSKSYGRGQGL